MARGLDRGTTLGGRYRLEELVGTGGMGSVYAAQDLERGHRVAVKVLRRRYAQRTEFRERFVAESRSAASIPHPHILTVHDHGVDDGWHYIVMALAPTDLATMLERDGPLPVTRALNVAEQVAWALDTAHAQGLIHRDVKPENVLVAPRRDATEPDHAYLADFGIAKLESAELGLTRTGVFVGTVSYASPEQITGGDLDGRSDQYSLACVVFECLTGGPPFTGDDAETVLRAHAAAPRPDASSRRPGLPVALDVVLRRGLAVDRDDRYATCAAFVTAARAAVRDATTVRTPEARPRSGPAPTAPAPAPTVAGRTPPTAPAPAVAARTAPTAPAPTVAARIAPPPTVAAPAAPTATAPAPPAPSAPEPPVDGPAPPARPRRRVVLPVLALAAVVLIVGVVVVALSGGGGAGGPTGPGRSGSTDADASGAERAVRQTVRAFAAARGARATCATISAGDQAGCDASYETAQPTTFRVGEVRIGDELATADATHGPDGDRLLFKLAREDGVWRVTEVPTFDWKDPDEVAVAETVIRFASREKDACSLLAESIASQCPTLLPPKPVRYDIQGLSAGSTAFVSGELLSGDTDRYELVDAGDAWKITAID